MAFSFSRGDETLEAGFRRIALSQIDTALAELDDQEMELRVKVHQARKRCKKVRALLRLVRPGFAGYAAENAAFRDMARPLSGLRDAEALIESYDKLAERYGEKIGIRSIAPVGRRLARDAQAAVEDPEFEAKSAALRDALEVARERSGEWALDKEGFAPAATGLARIFARGRSAYRVIAPDATDEAFHDWRKHVKYHWYHARMLRGVWIAPMAAHVDAAGALAELLGDHHDLAVLRAHLAAAPDDFARADAMLIVEALIERRRREIEAEALDLAARLYAEKPEALARRWSRYWDAWRKPVSGVAASAEGIA